MKSADGKIELKPVLSVSADNRQEFLEQGSKIRERIIWYLLKTKSTDTKYRKHIREGPQPVCLWDYQAEDRTPLLTLTEIERKA